MPSCGSRGLAVLHNCSAALCLRRGSSCCKASRREMPDMRAWCHKGGHICQDAPLTPLIMCLPHINAVSNAVQVGGCHA